MKDGLPVLHVVQRHTPPLDSCVQLLLRPVRVRLRADGDARHVHRGAAADGARRQRAQEVLRPEAQGPVPLRHLRGGGIQGYFFSHNRMQSKEYLGGETERHLFIHMEGR